MGQRPVDLRPEANWARGRLGRRPIGPEADWAGGRLGRRPVGREADGARGLQPETARCAASWNLEGCELPEIPVIVKKG